MGFVVNDFVGISGKFSQLFQSTRLAGRYGFRLVIP